MKRMAFYTLGCRVNQYETQAIREELAERGFQEVSFEEESDLYLINTCAVTGESVRKSKQIVRRALRQKEKNPDALVCVCGCFAQGAGDDTLLSGVDLVTGNTGKSELASLICDLLSKKTSDREAVRITRDVGKEKEYEEMKLSRSHNARAFLKIQDGCNSFCSYCYVPIVRGRCRSRKIENVLEEAKRLVENGYREIVLTGIETGAYGEDFEEKISLCDLVEALQPLEGLERIRFGSLKPSVFTEEFCSRMASLPKVMPHFHLSLQSGSTRVLSAMRRKYSREDIEQAIATILRSFPDAGLSADLICGFPGETEQEFMETVSLVEKNGLLHTHIFPFSPREGTLAERMAGQISQEEKKRRASYLLEVARKGSESFAKTRVGREYRVLCERIRGGFAFGYTDNFIYTKTKAPSTLAIGDVFPVVLENEWSFSVETMTVLGKNPKTVDNFEKKL